MLGTNALTRLSASTRASGTDWALGVEARCRALLSDGQAAEDLYLEAMERSVARVSRSSTRAATSCTANGCDAAAAEWTLASTSAPRTTCSTRWALTRLPNAPDASCVPPARLRASALSIPAGSSQQEALIAQLARDGHSNPAIGAQLFISPRTVEYHLHKVFAKLDIDSRDKLRSVPSAQLEAPAQAT